MKTYIIFTCAAVMLQKPQCTGPHFQVEPFTLKFLDCEDCLTITVIPPLPCKVQQAVAYIRWFKRGLRATLSHPEDCMERWAGAGRMQRCLEAAGQPSRSSRQQRTLAVGMYQLLVCLSKGKWLGSLQSGHSSTGDDGICAIALGTKRIHEKPAALSPLCVSSNISI